MKEKIVKVVSILSPYKIVINAGSGDGMRVGQKVLVYGLSNESIKDPDTDEDLGKVEIIRGRGRIIHVQEKISTVESTNKIEDSKRVVKNYTGLQSFMGHASEETVFNNEMKEFEEVQISDYVRFE